MSATLRLTLYRLRGGAESPQKLGTTAQTPRTNASPAVSAAQFQFTCKSDISTLQKPQRVRREIGKSPSKSTPKRSSERLRHLTVSHGHNAKDSGDRHCDWPQSQTHFGYQTAVLGMRGSRISNRISTARRVRGGYQSQTCAPGRISLRYQCRIGAVALTRG